MTDRRQRRETWTCATWVSAAMAIAYVALAAAVAASPDNAIDRAIASAVQRATALDAVLRAASWFGYWPVDVLAPVVAIAGLFALRARLDACYLAASVLGAAMIDRATKLVVVRPRPPASHVLDPLGAPSFPSGHVTLYVALFGFLAIVAAVRVRARVPRGTAIGAAAVLVALVGPSRIYLGSHWPSDVLGGYLASGAWLVLVGRLYVSRARSTRGRRDP